MASTVDVINPKLRIEVPNSVQEGRFMPFLGAGASHWGPDPAAASPWSKVRERIQALHGLTERGEDRRYLESVASRRGLFKSNEALRAEGARMEGDPDHPLIRFQLSLIELGSELVQVFGDAMTESRAAVVEQSNYFIEIGEEDQRNLALLLLQALDQAQYLKTHGLPTDGHKHPDDYKKRFAADDVYEKLCSFTCARARKALQGAEFAERLAPHQHDLCNAEQYVNRPAGETLRLEELAWIEDLLWHTLRYDVPVYPSSRELAFHLSLTIPMLEPHAGGDLTELAELKSQYDRRQFIPAVTDWLRFCERRLPQARFHTAIAAALWFCHQTYAERKSEFPAIVFTTNYDRTIERALERLAVPRPFTYHVVFPVVAAPVNPASAQPGAGQQSVQDANMGTSLSKTIWLWQAVTVIEDEEPQRGPLYDCQSLNYDDFHTLDFLQGPIVVKLHGSPLQSLQTTKQPVYTPIDDTHRSYSNLEHALVLSESSYLQSVLQNMQYPEWVRRALSHPNRALWFLGYSMRDWNVRVRLYEQITTSKFTSLRYSMNLEDDLVHNAVLRTLNVDSHRYDLKTFESLLMLVDTIQTIVNQTEKKER